MQKIVINTSSKEIFLGRGAYRKFLEYENQAIDCIIDDNLIMEEMGAIKRDNPSLVRVVEEINEGKIDTQFGTRLHIVKVEDDTDWSIGYSSKYRTEYVDTEKKIKSNRSSSMHKIVANVGVGPFSLSHRAYRRFLRCESYDYRDYVRGLGKGGYHMFDIEADNSRLIKIVEEMGEDANALGSDLKIILVHNNLYWKKSYLNFKETVIIRTDDF